MKRILTTMRELPIAAILILFPVLICGLFGQFLAPHDPTLMNLSESLLPPSWLTGQGWAHVLGTDFLGRDVLSRMILGARSTLIVSVVGVVCAGIIGVFIGLFSGYIGGRFDLIIMRLVDMQMAMPAILLALLISAALGSGLMAVIVVIAIVFWTHYARVVRGETLSVKQRDFVVIARVEGCSPGRILIKHIIPHVLDSAVVIATLQLGTAVMLEAALSFLGLGVQPPAVAWGKMIAEARMYIGTAWWLPTFPGIAIMLTVLGANIWGDWLRDKLDPKLRQV
jgi:peptide/nickel transport system permease protein